MMQADKSPGEAEGPLDRPETVLSEIVRHEWLHSSPGTPAYRRQQPGEGWRSQDLRQGNQTAHDMRRVLRQSYVGVPVSLTGTCGCTTLTTRLQQGSSRQGGGWALGL